MELRSASRISVALGSAAKRRIRIPLAAVEIRGLGDVLSVPRVVRDIAGEMVSRTER